MIWAALPWLVLILGVARPVSAQFFFSISTAALFPDTSLQASALLCKAARAAGPVDLRPCATLALYARTSAQANASAAEANEAFPDVSGLADGHREELGTFPRATREGSYHFLSSFKLPHKLTFAGQAVPLDSWQVRERIEYEFYQLLEDEGESIILAKRTGRCFPPVEKQLAQAGLPDDLKYMLLVESKCVAAATSPKKASGPWQFIRATGKRYKLKSDHWKDDRRNLELSTEAAVKYLRDLRDLFNGDWFLAMAAYNAGEERIRYELKAQQVDDYWKLLLSRETMRYVPRIIAAKEIYSQPEKYLGLTAQDLYAPLETATITVTIKEPQKHLASLAKELGSYFLELKLLNPEITKDYLPRGTHQLKVPRQACPLKCVRPGSTP
jgi:hypothetical protein